MTAGASKETMTVPVPSGNGPGRTPSRGEQTLKEADPSVRKVIEELRSMWPPRAVECVIQGARQLNILYPEELLRTMFGGRNITDINGDIYRKVLDRLFEKSGAPKPRTVLLASFLMGHANRPLPSVVAEALIQHEGVLLLTERALARN